MALTRHLPGSRPMLAWLMAALLLVAQGLGLAHRVAHAPGLGQAVAGVAAPGHAQGRDQAHAHAHAHAHATTRWADGHEADTAECRLIDELAHADGLCDVVWATARAPQSSEVVAAAPAVAPRVGSASAYLARAPPQA
jgi:hypothetical protein